MQVVLAKVLGYVQWAIIGGAIFAERLLPALGYNLSPEVLQAIKDKRFGTILGAWCGFMDFLTFRGLWLSTCVNLLLRTTPHAWPKGKSGTLDTSACVVSCRFIGNMAVNSCTSTGAFEVFYDGQLVR